MNSIPKRLVVALLTAPLLALAQPPFEFGAFALVALVPWLSATRRSSAIESLVTGALVGTMYGVAAATWLPEAFLSLGSSGTTPILGFVFTAAWSKLLLFAGVGWVAQRVRNHPAPLQILAVAAAFALGEATMLRWSLGIPMVLLGHSQLSTLGVAQLAVVGGVPLLAGWVAGINHSLALTLGGEKRVWRAAAALVASWLIAALFGLPLAGAVRPPGAKSTEARILLVQPDLAHRARWMRKSQAEHLETVAAYTDAALAEYPTGIDAIVWPENLLTSPIDRIPELAAEVEHWVDQWNVPLISGFVRSSPDGSPSHYRSSVLWIEPGRGIAASIDKVRAVPLLESSSPLFGEKILAPLYGRSTRWPKVVEAASTGPLIGPVSLTPVLCYEALFPHIVSLRNTPDSLAILNLADDSWVAGEAATRQLMVATAFRAIENRLTLVRVAHGGLSGVIDPFGRIAIELPAGEWAHAVATLTASPPPTTFERLAILGLPLSTGVGVWWLLVLSGRRSPLGRARHEKEDPQ